MKKLLYVVSFSLIAMIAQCDQLKAEGTEGGSWTDLLTELAKGALTPNDKGAERTVNQNVGSEDVLTRIKELSNKVLATVGTVESIRTIDPETKGNITKSLLSFVSELSEIKNQVSKLNSNLSSAKTSENTLVDVLGKAVGTLFGGTQETGSTPQQNQMQNRQQDESFLGKILQQLGQTSK